MGRRFVRPAWIAVALGALAGCGLQPGDGALVGDGSGAGGGAFETAGSGGGEPGEGAGGMGGGADLSPVTGSATGDASFFEACGLASGGAECVPGEAPSACPNKDEGAGGAAERPGREGSEGGGGEVASEPTLGCKLDLVEGAVQPICTRNGSHRDGEPCMTSSDCAEGRVCNGASKTCNPVCCDDGSSCPENTYCALAPLATATPAEGATPTAPMCVPAKPCTILSDATCDEGETCTLVRERLASCVPAGTAQLCDPCEMGSCAPGLICSKVTGVCLQLCHTGAASNGDDGECGGRFCQGAADAYTDGIGVCVGGDYSCLSDG